MKDIDIAGQARILTAKLAKDYVDFAEKYECKMNAPAASVPFDTFRNGVAGCMGYLSLVYAWLAERSKKKPSVRVEAGPDGKGKYGATWIEGPAAQSYVLPGRIIGRMDKYTPPKGASYGHATYPTLEDAMQALGKAMLEAGESGPI